MTNNQGVSRRRVLTGLTTASVAGLAGCIGGSSSSADGMIFRELPEEYELRGERKVIIPESQFRPLDIEPGQQLRVGRMASSGKSGDGEDSNPPKPQNPAIFTHREEPPLTPDSNEIYLSKRNLERIGVEDGDKASLSPFAPNPDISTRGGARRNNEYIEQRISGNRREYLMALAPHGGMVEPFTVQQAKRIANKMGVAMWSTLGFDGEGREVARDRWFVPSPQISYPSYPKLEETVRRGYSFSVSFDGFKTEPSRTDGEAVAIGGLVSEDRRQKVASEVRSKLSDRDSSVSVYAYKTGAASGTTSDHLVNRVTEDGRSGIKVYQTHDVRRNYWASIADGVESALRDILNEHDSKWNED